MLTWAADDGLLLANPAERLGRKLGLKRQRAWFLEGVAQPAGRLG
jgi:hypothetical protein